MLCFTSVPQASAAELDEGAGFFDYLPAAPEIKLPKLTIPFWTTDLKKAKKAYNNGNFERAHKYFRRESEDGNVVADWYLAHMYRLGQGVPKSASVAYSYYTKVAESYDAEEDDHQRLRITVDSQVWLAHYQRVGIPEAGVLPEPDNAARIYLRLASTYGHPAAQFALGDMNMVGDGVKKNPQQGLKWLTAAARKRNPEAQAYLGDLYWSGRNVKKSETRAVMWYVLAMETVRPAENPNIVSRYNDLMAAIDADTKLEAEARAKVWSEQFPVPQEN
jgi:TPR repeat protein